MFASAEGRQQKQVQQLQCQEHCFSDNLSGNSCISLNFKLPGQLFYAELGRTGGKSFFSNHMLQSLHPCSTIKNTIKNAPIDQRQMIEISIATFSFSFSLQAILLILRQNWSFLITNYRQTNKKGYLTKSKFCGNTHCFDLQSEHHLLM